MNKYLKHLKVILKHKYEVMKCCFSCGLYLQGIKHDLSKFLPTEFFSSARYFQGNRSPIEAEKEDIGYSIAWFNHKGRNRHHWEWWTDFEVDGIVIASKIPEKYVYEMVCDFVGAGKAYNKGKWNQDMPLNYHLKIKKNRIFHPDTLKLFEHILLFIKNFGLKDTLHQMKLKSFKY